MPGQVWAEAIAWLLRDPGKPILGATHLASEISGFGADQKLPVMTTNRSYRSA
jgi:hypothetical protein